jgi:hypothetical protein
MAKRMAKRIVRAELRDAGRRHVGAHRDTSEL